MDPGRVRAPHVYVDGSATHQRRKRAPCSSSLENRDRLEETRFTVFVPGLHFKPVDQRDAFYLRMKINRMVRCNLCRFIAPRRRARGISGMPADSHSPSSRDPRFTDISRQKRRRCPVQLLPRHLSEKESRTSQIGPILAATGTSCLAFSLTMG